MQITCTSLQTDNHTSTSSRSFYRPDALPAAQPTASKHWRHWNSIWSGTNTHHTQKQICFMETFSPTCSQSSTKYRFRCSFYTAVLFKLDQSYYVENIISVDAIYVITIRNGRQCEMAELFNKKSNTTGKISRWRAEQHLHWASDCSVTDVHKVERLVETIASRSHCWPLPYDKNTKTAKFWILISLRAKFCCFGAPTSLLTYCSPS